MSKCFISYRHVKPDRDLADFLEKFLSRHKHKVFIDTQITIGQNWAKEIEKHLKSADNFVVLLSKESILSDMVREEVKLAYQEMKKRGDAFRIFPIRVDYNGELPYDLGAYLDPLQYARWKPGDDFESLAGQVRDAIEKHGSMPFEGKSSTEKPSIPGMQELFEVTDAIGAPLPAADPRLALEFAFEKGSVKPDSPFYIKRNADESIMMGIRRRGHTTRMKGTRQMGKSSLMARAYAEAKKLGHQSYYFKLKKRDESDKSGLETLCRTLAEDLAEKLMTPINPGDVWKISQGAQRNLTLFIEKALLKNGQEQVSMFFDDVDIVFDCPFSINFFSMLRSWHDNRATERYWDRLNLVIAYSTEPYLWIPVMNQSPFNVGEEILLEDFNFDQVSELNTKHGRPLEDDNAARELLDLTGGQPYLVGAALYHMAKEQCSLAELKESTSGNNGPFADHLRQILWNLQRNRALLTSLRQVLLRGKCKNEMHFERLKAAGLILGKTWDHARMRCKIYEDYFRNHL